MIAAHLVRGETVAFVLLRAATSIVAKAVAFWLVVLILLPFSAPFSTCDLASLLPATRTDDGRPPAPHGWPIPSVGDPSSAHALPFVRAASRVKLFAPLPLGSRNLADARPASRDARAGQTAPLLASSVFSLPLRI